MHLFFTTAVPDNEVATVLQQNLELMERVAYQQVTVRRRRAA